MAGRRGPPCPGRRRRTTEHYSLFKLDAATGSVVWRFQYDRGGTPHTAPHPLGALWVLFASAERLYALRPADGAEAWSVELPGVSFGQMDPMAVVDGRVYLALAGGGVASVDLDGRTVVAYRPDQETSFSAPAVGEGKVFAAARDGFLYALDSGTLRLLWRAPLGAQALVRPVYRDGVLFLPSRGNIAAFKVKPNGVDALWKRPLGMETYGAPLVYGGQVLVCEAADKALGFTVAAVTALDVRTGAVAWSHPLDSMNCLRSPVTDGVTMYAPDAGFGGEVYALTLR